MFLLIGMGSDTFISLPFWGQILSAGFLSKIFKLFWGVKIDINWVNLTPCQAQLFLQEMPLSDAKDKHFFALRPFKYYIIKEVGGWGQKMSTFDDLQYCKLSKWVGIKKSKK